MSSVFSIFVYVFYDFCVVKVSICSTESQIWLQSETWGKKA